MRVPPPIVMLVTIIVVYIAHIASPNLSANFPGQWVIGGAFILVGAAIDVISVMLFRAEKTTITPMNVTKASSLVTGGFYRFSRNPMYLGMALIITGIGVGLGTVWFIAGLGGFVLYINTFQISREEAALTNLFGEEFEHYKTRTRRWI